MTAKAGKPFDLGKALAKLTPKEAKRVAELQAALREVWMPRAENRPQQLAYASKADVIGYGGAAGGGKTDLGLGMALTRHKVVQVFRREGTELGAMVDRCAAIVGNREGLTGRPPVWRNPTKTCDLIEFCSVPHLGDEVSYQGRAKDFLWFDEASNFLEQQVRFLMGWVRSTDPAQLCQTLLTFNPPTTVDGRWVIQFFAPWLDKKHPNPAQPGELRWFYTDNEGKEREADGPGEVDDGKGRMVRPMSRTFIAARVADNPDLARSPQYLATLDGLTEPLRSLMRDGDFSAATQDDAFQCIPTAWVEAAMARWKPLDVKPPMDSLGADIAQGGRDNTILARRHGYWFDVPIVHPGKDCRDGPTTAGFILAAVRDGAVIHLDLFGVGAQPYGALMKLQQSVYGVNVGDPAPGLDLSGRMEFFNLRSQLVWRMREALDPVRNNGIAIPPDRRLLADLCAYTWEPQGRRIKVHDRQSMVDKLGRSPDFGSAYLLALMDTPCLRAQAEFRAATQGKPYDPMAASERSIGFSR